MERLSVCYISFSYYPGQGATALFEYSRNLARMGHEIYVIAATKRREEIYENVDKVVVRRIPVKTTKRRSLENIKFSYLARRVLAAMIKVNPPDIVHIFSYGSSFLIRLGNNPSKQIKWVHDIRSGSIGGFPWHSLGKGVQRFESTLFDATFVIDKATIGYRSGSKVFVAPIGVNLETFCPAHSRQVLSRYGVQEKDVVLVYSGSLGSQRKIENLIYAFWKASRTVENLRLVFLGVGENLNRLKLLTEKLEISDKVLFLGYVDYRQMPEFLSAADIAMSYVPIVSAYDRQPPQKTIEYLACSLPVIATETIGNKQFIIHEGNGLLTKDNANSLSEAIVRLSQDARLRKTLAQKARPSVKDYDWREIAHRKILPAYRRILQT